MSKGRYARCDVTGLQVKTKAYEKQLADQVETFKRPVYWHLSEIMMRRKFYITLSEYYDTRESIADVLGYEAWLPGIGPFGKQPQSV